MCYTVYLSTDSCADLSSYNTELVRFESIKDSREDPVICLLEFPHQWYVGSKTGCSCTFRHLVSIELGFGEPEDWYPEEQDELEATQQLYEVISTLLTTGHRVDCLDRWEGAKPEELETLDVSLAQVSKKAFRLFENYRFTFKNMVRSQAQ